MFRALTILATVLALTISAAPASARVGGKMHLEDISMGILTDKNTPKLIESK